MSDKSESARVSSKIWHASLPHLIDQEICSVCEMSVVSSAMNAYHLEPLILANIWLRIAVPMSLIISFIISGEVHSLFFSQAFIFVISTCFKEQKLIKIAFKTSGLSSCPCNANPCHPRYLAHDKAFINIVLRNAVSVVVCWLTTLQICILEFYLTNFLLLHDVYHWIHVLKTFVVLSSNL